MDSIRNRSELEVFGILQYLRSVAVFQRVGQTTVRPTRRAFRGQHIVTFCLAEAVRLIGCDEPCDLVVEHGDSLRHLPLL